MYKSDSLTSHAKEEFLRLQKLSRRNSFFRRYRKISSSLFRNLTRVSKLSTWDFLTRISARVYLFDVFLMASHV